MVYSTCGKQATKGGEHMQGWEFDLVSAIIGGVVGAVFVAVLGHYQNRRV